MKKTQITFPSWLPSVAVFLIFSLGLFVRLIDLTDPPLDFNPTRQLRSAIIARGLYYQSAPDVDPGLRELAIDHWSGMERLEPLILEHIVAFTYRLMGGENLWVSRVFSSIFWLIGAAALYDLGRRMASPWAALIGSGYFLFIPFSIRASRSFQPDPAMVMWILLAAWAIYRWSDEHTWKWTLLTGIFGGMAAFTKISGAFFVGGLAFGTIIYVVSFQHKNSSGDQNTLSLISNQIFRNPKIWTMAVLMVSPALIYYLLGSEQTSGYFTNWTIISRWRDVLELSFYMRWMVWVDEIMLLSLVFSGFLGTLVTSPRNRALLWGLWGGYILFGLTFPRHTLTHDYYHLPLVGIVGLSLIPLADLAVQKISQKNRLIQFVFAISLGVFYFYNAWIGRSILISQDFSNHPKFWQTVAEVLPSDAKIIGLTQDYGFRLMYYGWKKIALWPPGSGSGNFDKKTGSAEYFLITAKNQLNDDLSEYLSENFPIYAEGIGYLVYDLREAHP